MSKIISNTCKSPSCQELDPILNNPKTLDQTIQFALDQWVTNQQWFRKEPGCITIPDVIKTCITFGWNNYYNNYDSITK